MRLHWGKAIFLVIAIFGPWNDLTGLSFDWFDGERIRTHRLLVGLANFLEVNQCFTLTSSFLYSSKLLERIERYVKFTEGIFGAKRVTSWIMYSCHGVFTDQFIFSSIWREFRPVYITYRPKNGIFDLLMAFRFPHRRSAPSFFAWKRTLKCI